MSLEEFENEDQSKICRSRCNTPPGEFFNSFGHKGLDKKNFSRRQVESHRAPKLWGNGLKLYHQLVFRRHCQQSSLCQKSAHLTINGNWSSNG